MQSMQHVNVKLMVRDGVAVSWHKLIPIFHKWIRETALPGVLVDVADYSHVPNGPGVMLIGHDAFWSVDARAGRPGLLYNRRTALDPPADPLEDAYEHALTAARMLEQETGGELQFDEQRFEMFVNDRMLAPNTPETRQRLEPALREFYVSRFGTEPALAWESDPRTLVRALVTPAA